MKLKFIKNLTVASFFMLSLNACSTFFDKDNTPTPSPLVDFTQQLSVKSLWYARTGSGANNHYLKLTPAISSNTIFTANQNGVVTATDIQTGKSLWQTNTGTDLSGGAAADTTAVYVGGRAGDVYALNQINGKTLWKTTSSSEILAPAAASGNSVLVKTIDGRVTAFSTVDGHELWKYQETEPSLILRGSSAPQIARGSAIVGFENGDLVKLALNDGREQWQRTIADAKGLFAIQRMIDIDADPIILGNRVYAATYQGRVAALDFSSGEELWNHDISSYSGIASNGSNVFVSDAQSHVWAFNANSGAVSWEQTKLEARTITGPALIGHYVVVGDAEGYLHWMSQQDGHFVARTRVNSSGILAAPIARENILYVYTKDGHLAAYTIG